MGFKEANPIRRTRLLGMMLDIAASYDLNDVQHHLKETDPPIPSIGQVKKALNALNVKKTTGIDGIPAWFLKQYSA